MHRLKTYLAVAILFWPFFVFANEKSVIINEIAWMGSAMSASDEWIELYNNSGAEIDLSAWKLFSQDKSIKINLQGKIPGYGYFLLERTNDQAIANVAAEQIYAGALSNNGEYLKLINSENSIIDEVNCQGAWFAGNNATKQTMERISSVVAGNEKNNWQTSQNSGGTPKQPTNPPVTKSDDRRTLSQEETKNSSSSLPSSQPSPLEFPGSNRDDRHGLNQGVLDVVINEIMPSPEGSDAENEWIELYNANNFEVDLAGWQTKDKVGSTRIYALEETAKIAANGFLVLSRPQTKISLNNEGDGLELLNPSGQVIDRVNFEKAKQGQSWNKTANGYSWSIQTTPGKLNIIKSPETKSAVEKPGGLSASSLSQQKEALLAQTQTFATSSWQPKNKNIFATIIAIFIAAGSAVVAWQIKKRSTEI